MLQRRRCLFHDGLDAVAQDDLGSFGMKGTVESIPIPQRQHDIAEYLPGMGIRLAIVSRGEIWWESI